jgi:uncharacterized membrane protein
VDALAYVVTSGWASGISVYTTVLVTGLAGRFAGLESAPNVFERTDVLVISAVLAGCEFVADKIPYVDSAWDVVHTVIRTTFAAVIGALISGQAGDLNEALGAVIGGSTALTSHATKASLRLAVNASPEPFSNLALSLSEDTAVVGVLLLAIHHPWAALAIALALLLAGIALATLVIRRIRQGLRRLQNRYAGPMGAADG